MPGDFIWRRNNENKWRVDSPVILMGGRGFSCCGRNQIIYVLMDGFINMFLLLFCIARVDPSFAKIDLSFARVESSFARVDPSVVWSLVCSFTIICLFVYDRLSVRMKSYVREDYVISIPEVSRTCPSGLCHFDIVSFATHWECSSVGYPTCLTLTWQSISNAVAIM